jgi:hypothetical protein
MSNLGSQNIDKSQFRSTVILSTEDNSDFSLRYPSQFYYFSDFPFSAKRLDQEVELPSQNASHPRQRYQKGKVRLHLNQGIR